MFSSKTFTTFVIYFLLTNKHTCDQCDGGQHATASERAPNTAASIPLAFSFHRSQQSVWKERMPTNCSWVHVEKSLQLK